MISSNLSTYIMQIMVSFKSISIITYIHMGMRMCQAMLSQKRSLQNTQIKKLILHVMLNMSYYPLLIV